MIEQMDEPPTIVVTGDRNWTDRASIVRVVENLLAHTMVIHGGAKGLDTLFGEIARSYSFAVVTIEAQWERYGRAAGPIRNEKMLREWPSHVHAFHDDLKKSKGTKHCVNKALELGLAVTLHTTGGFPVMLNLDWEKQL